MDAELRTAGQLKGELMLLIWVGSQFYGLKTKKFLLEGWH